MSLGENGKMFGTLSYEMEVKVPASEAWEVYGTLRLAELILRELPQSLEKVDVLEGDGGTGTLLKLTFPPGTGLLSPATEKFVLVDNDRRIKVAELIEGGFLDIGFSLYRVKLEVIEKGESACITKTTIEYEAIEEAAQYASIEFFVAIMNVARSFLMRSKD